VAIPLVGSGELAKVGFAECFLCHVWLLVLFIAPLRDSGSRSWGHEAGGHAPNTGAQRMERARG
jgi:hypothetical protein